METQKIIKSDKTLKEVYDLVIGYKQHQYQAKILMDKLKDKVDLLGLTGVIDFEDFRMTVVEGYDYSTFDTKRFQKEHPEMFNDYQRESYNSGSIKIDKVNPEIYEM